VVPLNVIGDFGGGGLLMAFGVVCALLEARRSGRGQVVDAAMVDGALSFMAMFFGYRDIGQFADRTGSHLLGGGAHYYEVYETRDGKHLAVAPIEPQFYRIFVEKMGLDPDRYLPAGYPNHERRTVDQDWPRLKEELAVLFKTRTRDEWMDLLADSDTCVTPVLTLAEAGGHPQHRARHSFIDVGGLQQQAPAPRFSRTPAAQPLPPPDPGRVHGREVRCATRGFMTSARPGTRKMKERSRRRSSMRFSTRSARAAIRISVRKRRGY